MIDVAGESLNAEDREVLQHPLVGGVILFSRNYTGREQVTRLVDEIRSLRSPPLLVAVDQEGGRVQRFQEDFTRLPPLAWLGQLHDANPEHAHRMAGLHARLMATELLDTGVDFSFAPVVDIDHGLCEVIGDRALHQDPNTVARLALAYMQGMRQAGMAAVAKHFPGHGGVEGDSHLLLPEDHRSREELLDDLHPYTTLIDDGLHGVMMAHVRYADVHQSIASMSSYWIRDVLRNELGFAGAVFSDDLSMAGAGVVGDIEERARIALQAGADMILICNDRESVGPVIEALADYDEPASAARLPALRADRKKYTAAEYGSEEWDTMIAGLSDALADAAFSQGSLV
ncbi:MAG: beta-N-acetylhexosaminidase [Gammaproteobacteria bacterium]|jgi:beta-N-acetylhexosaminidase|nr:beta-N-acetylhexosaminidase [Gammaproteobacteria bacterium]